MTTDHSCEQETKQPRKEAALESITKAPRNVPKKSGGAKITEYLEMTFRKRANQVTTNKM